MRDADADAEMRDEKPCKREQEVERHSLVVVVVPGRALLWLDGWHLNWLVELKIQELRLKIESATNVR